MTQYKTKRRSETSAYGNFKPTRDGKYRAPTLHSIYSDNIEVVTCSQLHKHDPPIVTSLTSPQPPPDNYIQVATHKHNPSGCDCIGYDCSISTNTIMNSNYSLEAYCFWTTLVKAYTQVLYNSSPHSLWFCGETCANGLLKVIMNNYKSDEFLKPPQTLAVCNPTQPLLQCTVLKSRIIQ